MMAVRAWHFFLLAVVGLVLADTCVDRCGQVATSGTCGCDKNCGTKCCSDYKDTCYSCVGRCDAAYDTHLICQCNEACRNNYNCCSDYTKVCDGTQPSTGSCEGRCDQSFDASQSCQCNSSCQSKGDCCDDYEELCDAAPALTDATLRELANELSLADTNGVGVGEGGLQLNFQKGFSSCDYSDPSPLPLVTNSPQLQADTFVKFERLRDNYNYKETQDDQPTPEELAEIEDFLDAVMATAVMEKLQEFTSQYDLLPAGTSLRDHLREIWFTPYPRAGTSDAVRGSSGFEHVFMGEVDGGDIGGFHSWVSYLREEQAETANYLGWIERTELGAGAGYVLTNCFTWHGADKPIGGYLVGPSVEHDLAVFTLCFLARPGQKCGVRSHGVDYKVQTYKDTFKGSTVVASAYPEV